MSGRIYFFIVFSLSLSVVGVSGMDEAVAAQQNADAQFQAAVQSFMTCTTDVPQITDINRLATASMKNVFDELKKNGVVTTILNAWNDFKKTALISMRT